MRRVHRGGEGQYLINGTSVRRTDLVELLADVGLGGAAGSVISQGKVEQILASKPEERRARGRGGGPREVQATPSPSGAEARAGGTGRREGARTSRRR